MTYLVTGATGFIGSYVVDRLLRDAVIALDRRPDWARELAAPDPSALTFVEGDVTDFSLVADLVSTHRVDRIIHLAAELHDRSVDQRGQCIQSNVVGTYNVLEAARLLGVSRTVLASSAALFSPAHHDPARPIAEDARIHGGATCTKAARSSARPWASTTCALSASPTPPSASASRTAPPASSAPPAQLVDELVTKPLVGEPGRPAYHGGSMMNMVYIHDTADAFVRASEGPVPSSHVYHVRGDYRSIGDMVEVARKLIPGATIEPGDADHRWPMNFDDSLFRREYGYTTRWSLEDALADIVKEKRSETA
ncbi:NAD-dependent epimerase/dehydratase family protein [Nonomuraea ferruginea]